jgi:hypothetical protein
VPYYSSFGCKSLRWEKLLKINWVENTRYSNPSFVLAGIVCKRALHAYQFK